jgi:cytochrome c
MRTALSLLAISLAMVSFHVNARETSRGQEIFERRCAGCHSLDREKEGPHLRGVYGRNAGAVPTFTYSDSMKKARITWDATSLDRWLTDPETLVPETDMAFRLTNPDERTQVIAYLKQISERE